MKDERTLTRPPMGSVDSALASDCLELLEKLISFTGSSHYKYSLSAIGKKLGAIAIYVAEPAATLRDCCLEDRSVSVLALSHEPFVSISEYTNRVWLRQCATGRAMIANAPEVWNPDDDDNGPLDIRAGRSVTAAAVPLALGVHRDRAALTAYFADFSPETIERLDTAATAIGLAHDFIQERKSHQLTSALGELLTSETQANPLTQAIDAIREHNRLAGLTLALAEPFRTYSATGSAHHDERTMRELLEYFNKTTTDSVFLPDLQRLERDEEHVLQRYPGLPIRAFRADRTRFKRRIAKAQRRAEPTISDLTVCLRESGRQLGLVRLTGCTGRPFSLRQREVLRLERVTPLLRGVAQRTIVDARWDETVRSVRQTVSGIHTLNKEIRTNAAALRKGGITLVEDEGFDVGFVRRRRAEELKDPFYSIMLAHVADAVVGADILSIRTMVDPDNLGFVHTHGVPWRLGTSLESDDLRGKLFPLTSPLSSAGAAVFQTGRPSYVADYGSSTTATGPYNPTFRVRSAAYVPVQAGDLTIGVLDVRSTNHEFSIEDRAACEILGQIIGLTVELRSSIKDELERSVIHVTALEDLNHQIKSPLGLVMKRADLAIDVLSDYSTRAANRGAYMRPRDHVMFLRAVAGNALRVAQSVSSYVELATHGKLQPRRDRLSLSVVSQKVSGLIIDASLLAREESKTIRMEDGLPTSATGARCIDVSMDYLQQVVQQLLDNAVKYAWEGSQIVVRTDLTGDSFRLAVISKGVRVSPIDEARVFERHYRAPAAVDASEAGSGIGLWIVRAIVESAGGQARLSADGDRTIVTLSLPLSGRI